MLSSDAFTGLVGKLPDGGKQIQVPRIDAPARGYVQS